MPPPEVLIVLTDTMVVSPIVWTSSRVILAPDSRSRPPLTFNRKSSNEQSSRSSGDQKDSAVSKSLSASAFRYCWTVSSGESASKSDSPRARATITLAASSTASIAPPPMSQVRSIELPAKSELGHSRRAAAVPLRWTIQLGRQLGLQPSPE